MPNRTPTQVNTRHCCTNSDIPPRPVLPDLRHSTFPPIPLVPPVSSSLAVTTETSRCYPLLQQIPVLSNCFLLPLKDTSLRAVATPPRHRKGAPHAQDRENSTLAESVLFARLAVVKGQLLCFLRPGLRATDVFIHVSSISSLSHEALGGFPNLSGHWRSALIGK